MSEPSAVAERVVLVGLMGSGKTTVGRLVARRLGWTYWDNDAELTRRSGMSLEALVALPQEELHRRERRVLVAALTAAPRMVVAAPGSVVPVDDEVGDLLARCFVVWLRATPQTLSGRVRASSQRRATGPDARERLAAQSAARAEFYAAVADLVVDVDDTDPSDVADAIIAALTASADAASSSPASDTESEG